MFLLFTDETNTQPVNNSVKFFVYGGIIFPLEKLDEIHLGIEKIRKDNGYSPLDSFKFDTNSRPKHITADVCTKAKNEVVNLLIDLKCTFIVYIVLHKIANQQGLSKTLKWAADHIIGKFNYFLKINNSSGIVVVDRFTDTKQYDFLTEKFTEGLILSDKNTPLENIRVYASSCNNASHLNSATDIILGSFRYCINNPPNEKSAKTMIRNITKLIWADKVKDGIDPFEKGLTLRPKTDKITKGKYKKEYQDLIDYINSLLAISEPNK